MSKIIELTQDQATIVDDEDYDRLIQWKWYALWAEDIQGYYAMRGVRGIKRRTISMARVIMRPKQREVVDHINHNTLDNRRSNLRICTYSQNGMNRRRLTKGVYWSKHKRCWQAAITYQGRFTHIGYFTDKANAMRAYEIERRRFYE